MDIEVIWAAGFFDGEGTVMLDKPRSGNRYCTLYAKIGSIDRESLEIFHRRWGGSLSARKGNTAKNERDSYYWSIAAQKAATFLADIQPYVVLEKNKRRIRLALEFQAGKTRPGCRPAPDRLAIEADFKKQIAEP